MSGKSETSKSPFLEHFLPGLTGILTGDLRWFPDGKIGTRDQKYPLSGLHEGRPVKI